MLSKKLWLILGILALVAIALTACLSLHRGQPQTMRRALTGYVLEVTPEMNRITVRNADVLGIMSSMVMDYRVEDTTALARIKPDDIIQATMVADGGNSLEDIKVTGKR